jgi:hypothetical protein
MAPAMTNGMIARFPQTKKQWRQSMTAWEAERAAIIILKSPFPVGDGMGGWTSRHYHLKVAVPLNYKGKKLGTQWNRHLHLPPPSLHHLVIMKLLIGWQN